MQAITVVRQSNIPRISIVLVLGVLFGSQSCLASTDQKRLDSPHSQVPEPSPIILQNGAMTLGNDVPGFWHHRWVGTGKISISRDTQVFKQGPAALRLSSSTSPAKGQVFQLIKGSPGQSFTLSGFAKSKGKVKVNVAVQSFSRKSQPIKFQQVLYLRDNQDWTPFSQTVTLPSKTHQFGITLLIEGNGQAWLDEVKISGENVKNTPGNPAKLAPPKKQDPTIPMHGYYPKFPQAWLKLHRQHLKQARKRDRKIVFLGDSITRGWRNHQLLWQKHFGKHGAVNFGIGGDRTQQILWRIDHGLFDQMQPQLVVLNIGVNNLWSDKFGAERIAVGIEKIVEAIHAKSPQSKILLLGILPTGEKQNTTIREKILTINRQIERLDNSQTIRFLDMGPDFLESDGTISTKIMPDHLHLSKRGYQIWATSMQKTFTEMLKE